MTVTMLHVLAIIFASGTFFAIAFCIGVHILTVCERGSGSVMADHEFEESPSPEDWRCRICGGTVWSHD